MPLPLIVAVAVAALVTLAFFGSLLWIALRRRPARRADIPPAMRPGPADEALERSLFVRLLAWNTLFVLFFAGWLSVYWFFEPRTNAADQLELVNRSVERGEGWFQVASEANPTGFGCAQCHGPSGEGGSTVFQGQEYPAPPLNTVCGGPNTGHPLILSLEDIRDTIMQGRPGTPMPSWSVRYEGPMNDQQIQDLINYLITIQEGVPDEQNVCTNPQAAAAAATPSPQESPGPTPSPTPGATPVPGQP